ncbi:MAG: glutathione S-transferase [Oceanospirillaceae bacterium]
MALASIIIVLALLEYALFSMLVGWARNKYHVNAPAVSGHPIFERFYRVQQNTLELLVIFIPSIIIFTHYVDAQYAAALGVVFLLARLVYLKQYVSEPKSRAVGFIFSFFSAIILAIGGAIGAAMQLWF